MRLAELFVSAALVFWAAQADARSSKARQEFVKANPCPATALSCGPCPGWVVDHIVPLKRGGADHPSNMQWQTREEAKAKDRWE